MFYSVLSLLNLAIPIDVYLRDRFRLVNQVFGFFGVTIALWTLNIGLAHNLPSLLVVRSTFAVASLMLLGLLTFFFVFPSSPFPRHPLYILFAVVCLSFFGLSFSPLLVQKVSQDPSGLVVSYGALHKTFGLFIYASLAYSLLVLWRKLRTATGLTKLQLRYLFLGLLLPGIAMTVTNLFIPLVFGISYLGRYGPAFSLVFVGLTAHVIIRHRLMNTRLVIRRGVTYILAVSIAGGVLVSVVGLASLLVAPRPLDLPLWAVVGVALLIALLFQPLKRRIQISLDRYLYREPYDYQRTIRDASRNVGSMLDFKSLLNYVCEVIGRTLRPETVSIYIRNEDGTAFARGAMQRFIGDGSSLEPETTLPQNSPLLDLLARTRNHLLRDEVERLTLSDAAQDALRQLASLGGEMALPILHEQQLAGILIVGPKLSGDPYFAEDIDLLSTLVGQAAIAIKNAQLYHEVTIVNEYVANIVATMESGVIAVGANGRVTLFNPAAERMTGLRTRSVRSGPVASLPVTLAQALEATLADGQSRVQPETTIPDATGRLTPISYSTYPLRDRSGTALGAVAVFADLTRLKELEGERRRAERLASFGALASGIAHEIKNPLVAIKTFAELLPERFAEEDFREDFSRVVIREIERIDDLVARLRGLAAPPAQPLAPLDLREPIEDTLALLRAQLEQKGTRLRRLYDPALPPVAGDPAQLKQLFLNLFMNALEAMESGGELTIELQARSRHGAPTILARVSDTGTGIPEDLLGKIFDPFVTTKPRGSGLGLAICRRITDAHGATIRAENNFNRRGSTIAIAFPAVAAMAVTINE